MTTEEAVIQAVQLIFEKYGGVGDAGVRVLGMTKAKKGMKLKTTQRCSIQGCEKVISSWVRGWCRMHDERWRRGGDPNFLVKSRDHLAVFWSLVEKTDGCWLWTGARVKNKGYGYMTWGKDTEKTHRISFFLANGYWPQLCRHTCDNPPCVNPSHLLDGTPLDNVRDMLERKRHIFGEKSPNAKLTDEKVRIIRRRIDAGVTLREIGSEFGVSRYTIGHIKAGKAWKHVQE